MSFGEAASSRRRPTSASPACRRQGQDDRHRRSDRPLQGHDPARPRVRAAARDAKAILRQKTLLGETYVELTPGRQGAGDTRRAGGCRREVADTVELDEIFRAFDRETRKAFQTWMQTQAQAFDGRGAGHQRRARQPRAVRRGRDQAAARSSTRRRARSASSCATPATVFDALSERHDQLRSLINNSNRVFATTAARDAELGRSSSILPTFETESQTTLAPDRSSRRKANPLVTQLRPAARRADADARSSSTALAPDLKRAVPRPRPADRRLREGPAGDAGFLDELHPLLANFDPGLRQLNPVLVLPRAVQERAQRVLRQRRRRDPGHDGDAGHGRAPCTTCARRTRSTRRTSPRIRSRIGTNRRTLHVPGRVQRTSQDGLLAYETRQCGTACRRSSTTGARPGGRGPAC